MTTRYKDKREAARERLFEIIRIGNTTDKTSKAYDFFISAIILINLFATMFSTYEQSKPYKEILNTIELITVLVFTIEFVLKLWTADFLYTSLKRPKAALKYCYSFNGIVDIMTFLPFYVPFVFPQGAVAFMIFRVIRIFRLFNINSKYDAVNVIVDVLKEKGKQIMSSMVMIVVLMLASSLCMYSLEHEAQPEVFANAFSGIWWSASTLLTVGYGDIYPVTTLGRIMAIILSFLGVGLVAIPTGIISAGFVEQNTKLNKLAMQAEEKKFKFISSVLTKHHPWNGKMIKDVLFPPDIMMVALIRDEEEFIPKGDFVMQAGDVLVFSARHFARTQDMKISEIQIKEAHDWVMKPIKELPISRQEMILLIIRENKSIIPNGNTIIHNGDRIIMYSKF